MTVDKAEEYRKISLELLEKLRANEIALNWLYTKDYLGAMELINNEYRRKLE